MPPRKKKAVVEAVVTDKTFGVVGEFPLPEGHYFTTTVTTRAGHSGETEAERAAVRMIQQQIGRPATGIIDLLDVAVISGWREEHGLGRGTFVDRVTWEQMRATPLGDGS